MELAGSHFSTIVYWHSRNTQVHNTFCANAVTFLKMFQLKYDLEYARGGGTKQAKSKKVPSAPPYENNRE